MTHRVFMIRKQREKEREDSCAKLKKTMGGGRDSRLHKAMSLLDEAYKETAGVSLTIGGEKSDQVGKGSEGFGLTKGIGNTPREKDTTGDEQYHRGGQCDYRHHRMTGKQHLGGREKSLSMLIHPLPNTKRGNKDDVLAARALQQAAWDELEKREARRSTEALAGHQLGGCFPSSLREEAFSNQGAISLWISSLNNPTDLVSFDTATFLHNQVGSAGPEIFHKAQGHLQDATSVTFAQTVPRLELFPQVSSVVKDLSSQKQVVGVVATIKDGHQENFFQLLPRKRKINIVAPSLESMTPLVSMDGGCPSEETSRYDAKRSFASPALSVCRCLSTANSTMDGQSCHDASDLTPGENLSKSDGSDIPNSGVPEDATARTQGDQGFGHDSFSATSRNDSPHRHGSENRKEEPDTSLFKASGIQSFANQFLGNDGFGEVFYYSEILAEDTDPANLSPYQCELRKHLELFEADPEDVRGSNTPGRHGRVELGQVGLRCRYCAHLDRFERPKGAANYSGTVEGVYQIAQNISKSHLCGKCQSIPNDVRNRLIALRTGAVRSRSRNCKNYWADSIRKRGIFELARRDAPPRLMRRVSDVAQKISTAVTSGAEEY
ncbi:hypothetical protein IV203_001478 [Nitzschia inconspicua]|uniref:Uncharacterized protein n=1 Tax=Nitzschia inconspicua TaxID=303405 RepID=A0A9K3L798_9STRA|nr:hypothetical protein IV203_001478 [Nitzschia inconspicua]